MEINAEEYPQYRLEKMKLGIEYQDFICEQLHARGIVLQNMTSKKYQYKQENLLGLEIKFDSLIDRFGRVYIETAEKAEPRDDSYVKSGIYRNDKSWLYGIGDYSKFFIFAKTTLCRLDKNNPNWLYRPPVPKQTSIGFCIPLKYAIEIADRVIFFE